MFRIEKISEDCFYIKSLGTFLPSVAERFVKEFEEKTRDLKSYSVIVDNLDVIILDINSFDTILNLLKRSNEKVRRSAFVISRNPPLDKEYELLLKKAESPNRKIVKTLDEAKEWVGIEKIIFKKE